MPISDSCCKRFTFSFHKTFPLTVTNIFKAKSLPNSSDSRLAVSAHSVSNFAFQHRETNTFNNRLLAIGADCVFTLSRDITFVNMQ